jgi:hypothetical protein
MSIEAMKQALEALEDLPLDPKDYIEEAVEILRQAIEQAEKQEPVAYINVEQRKLELAKYMKWETPTVVHLPKIPLYTTPQPQREWVGLTDDEVDYIADEYSTLQGAIRAIEAKLKEKNT